MDPSISTILHPLGTELRELLHELGNHTASLLGSTYASRRVLGTEFYDALDTLPEETDIVLLTPSAASMTTEALNALAGEATRLNYAAIAVKCRDNEVALMSDISDNHGIPFVRVSERVSWSLFDATLSQLLGERRHVEDSHRDRSAEPLFALANELAEYFGGSVAIEDLGRRIIAYSSVPGHLIDALRTKGILTRNVPNSPFNDDQYRTVLRSEIPVKYPKLGDEEPRVACAIRAGALPLGTIWAIDASGNTALTDDASERVSHAANLAAAYMLNDLRVRKATQLPREDLLRSLLDGGEVQGSEFAELGLSEERGATLLVFSMPFDEHPTTTAQLRSTVQRHLTLRRPEAVTVIRHNRVYALVAGSDAQVAQDLTDSMLPLISRLVSPNVQVAAPGAAYRPGNVAALREVADTILDVAARHQRDVGKMLTTQMMLPLLLFERVSHIVHNSPELQAPSLDQLQAKDPALTDTVLSWCGSFGNVAKTARLLNIHENTVRNHLRIAEEIYGIDLTDADVVLFTWLYLRAHRTRTD